MYANTSTAVGAIALLTVISLAIDAVWLTVRQGYHMALFKAVQGTPIMVRYFPALLVYIILAAILYMFVIRKSTTAMAAAKTGALLGGAMYAFYDATNLATLRGWTWEMAITDSVWGAVLSGVSSGVGFWSLKSLGWL